MNKILWMWIRIPLKMWPVNISNPDEEIAPLVHSRSAEWRIANLCGGMVVLGNKLLPERESELICKQRFKMGNQKLAWHIVMHSGGNLSLFLGILI